MTFFDFYPKMRYDASWVEEFVREKDACLPKQINILFKGRKSRNKL